MERYSCSNCPYRTLIIGKGEPRNKGISGRRTEWKCPILAKIELSRQDVIAEPIDPDDKRGAAGSSPGREDTGRRGGSSAGRPHPGFRNQKSAGSPRSRPIHPRPSGSEAPLSLGALRGERRPDRPYSARSVGECCAGCRDPHRHCRHRLAHLVRQAPCCRFRPGRSRSLLSFPCRFQRPQHHWCRLRRGRPPDWTRRHRLVPSRLRLHPGSKTLRAGPLPVGPAGGANPH
jgi:hypothetical protein